MNSLIRPDLRRRACLAAVLVGQLMAFSPCSAQSPDKRPAADQVVLRSGAGLRGAIFERTETSITLLVREKWLSQNNMPLHARFFPRNLTEHQAALDQAKRRLEADGAIKNAGPVGDFLRQQLQAVIAEQQAEPESSTRFIWLSFPIQEIERITAAAADDRPLLAWGWLENLDRVEDRTVEELKRDFKMRRVDPVGWPLALIEQFPARPQSDDEWTARRALIDFAFGRRLEFQGTGSLLLRTDEKANADLGKLILPLLRDQLQKQLNELLADKPRVAQPLLDEEALKTAIRSAETENLSGFRATRLDLGGEQRPPTVTSEFLARFKDGAWRTLWRRVEKIDVAAVNRDLEARILADPQVKQVLEFTQTLGVANDQAIQQAIRFGAATMKAQQDCDREFTSFRDVYMLSLAKPPLVIPTKP
jgi:hypothetical protein